MKSILVALFILIALSACNSSKTPKDAKIVPLSSKTEFNSNMYSIANFTLQLSPNWEKEPPSNNMRVAQFKLIQHSEYELVLSYFGNMDNQEEANINRWKKQFSVLEEYTELELSKENLRAIKLTGTFKKKAFPMAQDYDETPNYGTLAAIIPSSEGPYFLKLTAPKEIIEEQNEVFIEVLNSYSIK